MHKLIPLVLAVGAPCALVASDLHPADFRVTALLLPESENIDAEYHFADNSGVAGDNGTLEIGFRVEIGLVTTLIEWSPAVSLVGGGWAFYGEQESDGRSAVDGTGNITSGPMECTTIGIDLYLALKLQLERYLSLEVGPVVGAGTTRFTDRVVIAGDPGAGGEELGHGQYEEAGLNFGLFVQNEAKTLMLGLGARYLVSYGEADNRFNGVRQDVEIRQHGLAPYLLFGTTF